MTIRETVRNIFRADDRPDYWKPDYNGQDLKKRVSDVFTAMRWQTSCCWGFGWLLAIVNFWRTRTVTQIIDQESRPAQFEERFRKDFLEQIPKALGNDRSLRKDQQQDLPHGTLLTQQMKEQPIDAKTPPFIRTFRIEADQTAKALLIDGHLDEACDCFTGHFQSGALFDQLTKESAMTAPFNTALQETVKELNDAIIHSLGDQAEPWGNAYQLKEGSTDLTISKTSADSFKAVYTLRAPVFFQDTLYGHLTVAVTYFIGHTSNEDWTIGDPIFLDGLPTFTPV